MKRSNINRYKRVNLPFVESYAYLVTLEPVLLLKRVMSETTTTNEIAIKTEITIMPIKFWHIREVHAIPSR